MILFRRLVALVVLTTVVLVGGAGVVGAHTGFESSDPPDGATVDEPVDEMTLVFTGAAEPTVDGFRVLDPTGEIRIPVERASPDGRTWVLRFDPPLAGGVMGVQWMVKAPDAHPIDGTFSFTVAAPAAVPTSDAPEPIAADPVEPADDASPIEPVEDASPVERTDEAAERTDETGAPAAADLEEFLETDGSSSAAAERVGAVGRILTLGGTLVAIGAMVFAAVVVRGAPGDIRYVLHWVRRAGLVVVVGALVELLAQLAIEGGGSWSSAWSGSVLSSVMFSSFGLAVALRVAGGLAVTSGARLRVGPASPSVDRAIGVEEPVGVGARAVGDSRAAGYARGDSGDPEVPGGSDLRDHDQAWLPTMDSAGAFAGGLALLAAFLFHGHTVSKGNRIVTAVVDLVHVSGAAVWVGGILMLAGVLWRRHRQDREPRALELGVRFSVVATVALATVGAAGLVLTVVILDAPSELWSTTWGRLLMAKTLFVAVAAAAGAYNHSVLVPQMDEAPGDAQLASRFRSVVTVEAVVLGLVVVLTAFLIGAAS